MRPENVRRSIALYTRWHNPENGLVKPVRRILSNVYLSEQTNTAVEKTGTVLKESTFIQVFSQNDLEYIPFQEWETLPESDLDGRWSVQLGATASIIVPFVTDYEFDFVAPNKISETENAFMKNTHGAIRIDSIEDNRRGTFRSRHISIYC